MTYSELNDDQKMELAKIIAEGLPFTTQDIENALNNTNPNIVPLIGECSGEYRLCLRDIRPFLNELLDSIKVYFVD